MWCCSEAPEVSVDFHQGVPVLGDTGVIDFLQVFHEGLACAIGFWVLCCYGGDVFDAHLLQIDLEGVAWVGVERRAIVCEEDGGWVVSGENIIQGLDYGHLWVPAEQVYDHQDVVTIRRGSPVVCCYLGEGVCLELSWASGGLWWVCWWLLGRVHRS